MPAGRLIEEQLRRIIRQQGWALMDVRINHFDAFKEVYGFVAGDDVLRFTAMLMGEVVDELGTPDDFIGHAGGDNFIIITTEERCRRLRQAFKARFAEEVQTHYSFIDRQQGYILVADESGQPGQNALDDPGGGDRLPHLSTNLPISARSPSWQPKPAGKMPEGALPSTA